MMLLTCFCKSSSKPSSIVTPAMKLSRVSSLGSMLSHSLSSDDISVVEPGGSEKNGTENRTGLEKF